LKLIVRRKSKTLDELAWSISRRSQARSSVATTADAYRDGFQRFDECSFAIALDRHGHFI
jgi:hypothetical protein